LKRLHDVHIDLRHLVDAQHHQPPTPQNLSEPSETPEVLLKADLVNVAFERAEGDKNPCQ
jgi:hypothetical protein